MAAVVGLRCLRCGTLYPPDHHAEDCPACRPVARSNLVVAYDETLMRPRPKPDAAAPRGLWRWGDVLPVTAGEGVSLGEGGSPLHHLARTGAALGLDRLHAKDETRNPTWSFKDRLACMAVSVAKRMGARVVVSSSTGNAGAAAAAYAAKAGLRCVVFTTRGAAGPMLTQMRAYGAEVVETQTKADRWILMEHAVRNFGWFPTSPFFGPVVGSNPYGIEGYKTLAYEIAEAMDWQVPDWCVLPVCYGDALVGLWRGFEEMRAFGWTDRTPRFVAAEVYGSLAAALADGGDVPPEMPKTRDTVAGSIGATRGTFQALDVLRRSGGTAVAVADADAMRWQARLAADEGLYVEPSTAVAFAAIQTLRGDDRIARSATVVALLTASGLKDPAATDAVAAPALPVPADTGAALAALRSAGIFPS
ncbi:pyridoxal-phosphate dependent enzyme [Rhodoplanes sp. TEM]|uniref:Pyridoxal-phosphate dependent enzyme n=1 Tax=Rhodoplanes tepidamans TaxID=200616 RepID=A0ABT5JH24_RHOTP|nr:MULTISPECIES: pyridoxal-phosphate dependent enzyme [Rhodoplanes]MDC7789013.1 pyridoxal-phosphate dependent enzyme [Rhodoplanes tepidamans]MDC7985549.1 pyridoxal-phosphate dependent enzyme [Rhodoplanes sp. TEM]MDQ0355277.1 threonine synthase [Rhodoplanes tepidamans]